MAFLTPMTNCTWTGSASLPAFCIATACTIIDRSNASTSGLMPYSSISEASQSTSSGELSYTRVGKLTDPVARDAMSGRNESIAPRSLPAPERPPVEICVMIPGQCLRMPSSTSENRSGAEVGDSSSLRTCRWTSVAPASKASCVDSICSEIVIGTAGLSFFFGSDPVIATVMMQGVVMTVCLLVAVPGSAPATSQTSKKTVSSGP